jgi:hypothetical protein
LGQANQMVQSAMTSHDRHIGFQDGRHEAHHEAFFCHNFGSIADTNIIQVAIPRFLGPANKMVPSAMTSHGRHIGFQDGHRCKCIKNFVYKFIKKIVIYKFHNLTEFHILLLVERTWGNMNSISCYL